MLKQVAPKSHREEEDLNEKKTRICLSIESKMNSASARLNKNSSSSSSQSRWNTDIKNSPSGPGGRTSSSAKEVHIAGIPFRVKTARDSETVQELVELVDLKVRQALSLTKSGSIQSAAILAALNLAEELILLKREARKELEKIESKVVRISRDLGEILEK